MNSEHDFIEFAEALKTVAPVAIACEVSLEEMVMLLLAIIEGWELC